MEGLQPECLTKITRGNFATPPSQSSEADRVHGFWFFCLGLALSWTAGCKGGGLRDLLFAASRPGLGPPGLSRAAKPQILSLEVLKPLGCFCNRLNPEAVCCRTVAAITHGSGADGCYLEWRCAGHGHPARKVADVMLEPD